MDAFSAIILILVTLFLPPVGVFFVAGCSIDLLINICLTMLGYFPGHIHAFYCEYVYFDRRSMGHSGRLVSKSPPGIYSKRLRNGGEIPRDYTHSSPPPRPAYGQPGYASNTPVQGQAPQSVGTTARY